MHHIEGLAQDCSNSIANAQELLQSCTKPLIYKMYFSVIEIYDLDLLTWS